jgi:hypothetical protein
VASDSCPRSDGTVWPALNPRQQSLESPNEHRRFQPARLELRQHLLNQWRCRRPPATAAGSRPGYGDPSPQGHEVHIRTAVLGRDRCGRPGGHIDTTVSVAEPVDGTAADPIVPEPVRGPSIVENPHAYVAPLRARTPDRSAAACIRLPHPSGLLQGNRLSMRLVPIRTLADAERPEIIALIREAAGLDPSAWALTRTRRYN